MGDLARIKQMVDNAPINMMYADLDLKIRYMNPKAEQTLKRLEAHLPIKVNQMIGQLDRRLSQGARAPAPAAGRPAQPAAHRDDQRRPRALRAERQRDDRPARQVHRADDHLGGRDREGRDWRSARRRPRPTSGRSTSCCCRWARCRSVRDVITAALSSVREAFGWSYGSFWEVNPGRARAAVRPGLGLGQRGVPPRHAPRRGSAKARDSTARPGRAATWSSSPTWAR